MEVSTTTATPPIHGGSISPLTSGTNITPLATPGEEEEEEVLEVREEEALEVREEASAERSGLCLTTTSSKISNLSLTTRTMMKP